MSVLWWLVRRRRPLRMTLQLQVTERCNNRCRHCYREAEPSDEMSAGEIQSVIEQFADLVESRRRDVGHGRVRGHVTFSGGEPFLRPDFPDILDECRRRRPRLSFAVLTNGSHVDDEVARHLSALRPAFVQVSLDGREPTHDRIRGAGDHARTEAAIRRLVTAGVSTVVSFTAHQENYREFDAVARTCSRLGVTRLWSDRLVPTGRGAELRTLDAEQSREFFRIMRRARRRARFSWNRHPEIAMHRALQFLEGGCHYACTAGDTLLAVQPDGDVYPCRRLPIRVGNVLETPLEQIRRDSEVLRRLRDPELVCAGCEGCRHHASCRGGLRCLAHAVRGDMFTSDPGCPLSDTTAATRPPAEPRPATPALVTRRRIC